MQKILDDDLNDRVEFDRSIKIVGNAAASNKTQSQQQHQKEASPQKRPGTPPRSQPPQQLQQAQ